MNKEDYIFNVKQYWTIEGFPLKDQFDEELEDLTRKYYKQFMKYIWTDIINKEVEELWLRKNSKLGKALK